MRDLFPGFNNRTDEELSECWQEGIFVFDTNMLLNVYRYTQKTRERYFEVLDLLKERNQLWIPYQVAYEYQDNRTEVIQGQLDAYTEVSNMLQTTIQKLESSLEPYKRKHGFIDIDKLTEELTSAIKKAKTTITQGKEKDKKEYEALKKHDRLLEKLEELFQGNIGSPYSNSRLEEIYRQAQLRIELRIPPGWEDEVKNSFKAYGDTILWFQLVDYARTQNKPIIFVTDDGKKDWWVRDAKGKPVKPLPRLVQEMFAEAGVLLHMYQGYEFLGQAEHFLKLEEKPDVIADAMTVTEQNTSASKDK
ncbi:MAG TPA: PIN domain-containing protein, partial [Methylomirabilota bacterium]|nr:PIN domain-containing protein [Methylomirabilota bacterium]